MSRLRVAYKSRGAALSLALLSARMAFAQDGLTPEEFGATVTGKTFEFFIEENGNLRAFGAERYFEDQSVVWMLTDGTCLEGVWFERNGEICFNYGRADDTCWQLDSQTPEEGATFSYSIGDHRQVAFPSTLALPATCDPLMS